jgi:hypothetical protein
LTSQAGTRVLMDPFGKGLGYALPQVQADIVWQVADLHGRLGMHSGKEIHSCSSLCRDPAEA